MCCRSNCFAHGSRVANFVISRLLPTDFFGVRHPQVPVRQINAAIMRPRLSALLAWAVACTLLLSQAADAKTDADRAREMLVVSANDTYRFVNTSQGSPSLRLGCLTFSPQSLTVTLRGLTPAAYCSRSASPVHQAGKEHHQRAHHSLRRCGQRLLSRFHCLLLPAGHTCHTFPQCFCPAAAVPKPAAAASPPVLHSIASTACRRPLRIRLENSRDDPLPLAAGSHRGTL